MYERTPNPFNVSEGGTNPVSAFGQRMFESTYNVVWGGLTIFPTIQRFLPRYGVYVAPREAVSVPLPYKSLSFGGPTHD